MEVYNAIINLISSVGFPIACCIILIWQSWKKDEQHKEEMKAINETIAQNTNAVIELTTIIKTKKGDLL